MLILAVVPVSSDHVVERSGAVLAQHHLVVQEKGPRNVLQEVIAPGDHTAVHQGHLHLHLHHPGVVVPTGVVTQNMVGKSVVVVIHVPGVLVTKLVIGVAPIATKVASKTKTT